MHTRRPLASVHIGTISQSYNSLTMTEAPDEALVVTNDDDDDQPTDTSPTTTTFCFLSPGWVELLVCFFFFLLCMIPFLAINAPRIRPIPVQRIQSGEYILNLVNDQSFDSDTVNDWVLFLVCAILPLLLQTSLAHWVVQRPGDVHGTVCTYLVAFGLTLLVTECVKSYAAYLRPSFFDLCEPTANYTSCLAPDSSDARKSFPSGHASTAFCGLSLLSMYLQRSFGIDSVRELAVIGNNTTIAIRYKTNVPLLYRLYSTLCLLPVALAIFIAVSRVVDNKHFPADIVGGALLGTASAFFAHRLWFPSLL